MLSSLKLFTQLNQRRINNNNPFHCFWKFCSFLPRLLSGEPQAKHWAARQRAWQRRSAALPTTLGVRGFSRSGSLSSSQIIFGWQCGESRQVGWFETTWETQHRQLRLIRGCNNSRRQQLAGSLANLTPERTADWPSVCVFSCHRVEKGARALHSTLKSNKIDWLPSLAAR